MEGRFEILLQEYHRGEGHGVELLLYRGRPLAAFQHRRLHEVPITGGASSFRESVSLDPTLYEYSTRLLAALEWTGLAMVEFKLGEDGPTPHGDQRADLGFASPRRQERRRLSRRGWPSSTSRVPPKNGRPPDTAYELGVRSRNLDLEVVWIASTLRGRQGRRLVLVPPRREGVEAAMRLLNPKDGFDVLSWDDPRPGLAEIAGIAAKLRRKVRS